jgi:DNA-binding protein YbaB
MQTIQFPSDKAFDTVMNAFSILLTSLNNDNAKIAVVHRVLGSLPADKLFEFEEQLVRMCDVLRGDGGTEVKAVCIDTAVLDTYKAEQSVLGDGEKQKIAQNILLRQEALKAKKLAVEKSAKKAAKVLALQQELEEAQRKIEAAKLDSDDEDEAVPVKVAGRQRTLVARPYQSVTIKPTVAVLEKTNPTKRVEFVEPMQRVAKVVGVTTSQKLWVNSSTEYMQYLTKGIPMCLYREDCAQVGCKHMHVKEEFVCQTPFGCKCSKIHD